MDKPTCKTCPFWKELGPAGSFVSGACHRHAPVVQGRTESFPLTFEQEFCGDHPGFAAWQNRMAGDAAWVPKLGDVVQLRSGGFEMTVTQLLKDHKKEFEGTIEWALADRGAVHCVWMVEGELRSGTFLPPSLKLLRSSSER